MGTVKTKPLLQLHIIKHCKITHKNEEDMQVFPRNWNYYFDIDGFIVPLRINSVFF